MKACSPIVRMGAVAIVAAVLLGGAALAIPTVIEILIDAAIRGEAMLEGIALRAR